MADRYWVGGTGTWNSASTTNWSASSGGASGASVPTTADSVFFDQAGTYTVTLTGTLTCLDLTVSAGTVTFTSTGVLIITGSLSLVAGTVWSATGTLNFTATASSKTLTTNGTTINGNVTCNGVGGVWTLGSALTLGAFNTLSLNSGTFSTSASNYAVTTGFLTCNNTGVTRVLNFNASTVTLTASSSPLTFTSSGLTFNAGTSQINCTGSSLTFAGGGLTFYNVGFGVLLGNNSRVITGANTFNNLSFVGPSTVGVINVTFNSNQTISGTLSTTGTAGNRRVFFASSTYGIGWTLTCNSAASLTDADFRNLYVIGTAAPISGTRIGNRGYNSGITFSTPKTVYWNLAGAQNWSATAWATTSTGTPSTDNFPLPQDTATFTNAGSVTGTITLDAAIAYCPTIDMSGRTSAMTLAGTTNYSVYGNWTNGSGTTLTYNGILTFSIGNTTQTITSASKTFASPITVDTYGGTVQLADALDIGTSSLTVTNGTFTTAGFAVTAGALSSSNSNVRTINLGASTVTLSAGGALTFSTSTNLTFTAGTSQITLTNAYPVILGGGGVSFYDVSATASVATNGLAIQGLNTFRNLSRTAPSTAGNTYLYLNENQTITGTLTVSGASAVRRVFVFSSDTANNPIFGTQRDLTVGTLVADDCDFRDIEILGTAIGTAPTRAGDCGNNSGITFPATKTVYWNLAGTQNWSATGWCTASGGTPAVDNFPLAQDTAVFDDTGAAGTVTFNATWNIGTFDAGARTSAVTFTQSNPDGVNVYGDFVASANGTYGGFSQYVMCKVGTQTFTSNGKTLPNAIYISRSQTTVQLTDAMSNGSVLLHSAGTFIANNYNVTIAFYTGNAASVLYMGSGIWTLTGGSAIAVWAAGTAQVIYADTSTIVLSDTSTASRTFTGGGLYYNKLTIGGATGTSTLTINGNNTFGELASTKTVGHAIVFGSTTQTFGKWSVTGTLGNAVTISGTSTTNVIAGPAVTGIDYLVMGTWGISTTSPGEFYAGANSLGTAAAPVFRTAAPAPRTLYWVGGTGSWASIGEWGTSSGGVPGAAIPTSLDAVIFDSLSNATAYTATISGVTIARCASFTMAGPASGNVTFAGTVGIAFHGNVTFAATGITRTYTGAMNWAGNASYTFTTNGLVLSSATTVIGIGSTWTLGSALNIGTSAVTVTYGTFDTSASNRAVTASGLSSANSNVRTINLNASTVDLSSTSSNWSMGGGINLTFNAGTSTINLSSIIANFFGAGLTYYNVSFTSTSISTVPISGANTFNNLLLTEVASLGIGVFSFSDNQTINGLLIFVSSSSSPGSRTFLRSDTIGTPRILTVNAVYSFAGVTDIDFRDITIAGAAAPISGTRFGDAKGNSGITFPAAKTVYYRQTITENWGASGFGSWSATSGGALDITMFPLAQDTAVFPAATYPASGSTTTINAAYNIGTIDMSLRTSNTMTLATSSNSPQIYGNWINGTGITLSGTALITFAGRTTQTITSAGKSFTQPIRIDSPSGSVTLQDAFTTSTGVAQATTLTSGTLDLNNFTLSTGTFISSTTSLRTITFGSGTIALTGTGTVWQMAGFINATINKGTGTISLTNTTTTARTFSGGGLSYPKLSIGGATGISTLTITGNNTFAEIASTKTVAHTISLAETTQTVGAFTATGTVGNLLTITGTSAASPATLIYTGVGNISGLNYLVPTFVRAYPTTSTWFAGANSTNGGSLGWIFDTASGNIYNVFFIDTATATDSGVGFILFPASITETATATDSPSVAASTFNAPIVETATATDSPSVAASTFNAPVAETATATDSDVGFILFPVSITETATATDSVLSFAAFNSALSETATATDSVLSLAAFSSALSETATATDSVLGLADFSSALSETATATDSVISFADFYAALAETATATDSPLVAPSTFNAPIAETATATDSPLVAPSTFNAPVSETVTISDLVLGLYLWNLIDDSQSVTWQNINSSPGTTWSPIDTDPDTGWSVIPTVN